MMWLRSISAVTCVEVKGQVTQSIGITETQIEEIASGTKKLQKARRQLQLF